MPVKAIIRPNINRRRDRKHSLECRIIPKKERNINTQNNAGIITIKSIKYSKLIFELRLLF